MPLAVHSFVYVRSAYILCFINSRLKVLPKMFKCTILVWNYGDDVNVPQSNRWRHLLCGCNAFSAQLTAASFLRRFLAFYCFKWYLDSFNCVFYHYYTPWTHWTRPNWRELARKKNVFWRESQRAGRSLITVNKNLNETDSLIFFSARSNFISLMNTKICIFTRGYPHSWKYCFWCSFGEINRHSWKYKFWCSFGEIKFDFTLKKINILYLITFALAEDRTAAFRMWSKHTTTSL